MLPAIVMVAAPAIILRTRIFHLHTAGYRQILCRLTIEAETHSFLDAACIAIRALIRNFIIKVRLIADSCIAEPFEARHAFLYLAQADIHCIKLACILILEFLYRSLICIICFFHVAHCPCHKLRHLVTRDCLFAAEIIIAIAINEAILHQLFDCIVCPVILWHAGKMIDCSKCCGASQNTYGQRRYE